MKKWGVLKTVVVTILVIFLALFIYVFFSVANFVNKSNESTTVRYCTEASMPEFAEISERYGMIDYFDKGTFYSFESKKYKNLDKLCEALPAGCEQAVREAVSKSYFYYTTDVRQTPVNSYEVDAEKLPLVSDGSKTQRECHYCVLQYPDLTYRFAVVVEY